MDKVNRSTIKTCKKFVPNVRTIKNIFTSDKISKKISEQHNLESCTEKFRHWCV